MRLVPALLLSGLLVATACSSDNYERVVGGGMIGAGAGAATGALCCNDPSHTGEGILIGFAIGALIGYLYDVTHQH